MGLIFWHFIIILTSYHYNWNIFNRFLTGVVKKNLFASPVLGYRTKQTSDRGIPGINA